MKDIVVVDYQAGNLRSVVRALELSGARPTISSDPEVISNAAALVLPGQGACDTAMETLRTGNLIPALRNGIDSGKPFLGICLGLQLLLELTEEGDAPCLGIFPGKVRRLPDDLKVPHMGWNQVYFRKHHLIFKDVPQNSNFYFVHSYYADPDDDELVVATTDYGISFCAALAKDNLVATQFHPEKSGDIGIQIYRNFIDFASVRYNK